MAVIQLIVAQSIPHSTAISSIRMPQDQWIARALDTLTLDQKIGQLIFVRSGMQQDMDNPVAQYHVGGIIFSEEKAIDQVSRLQQKSPIPLLVGVEAAPASLLTLGAVQDVDFLRTRAYQIAQQHRAMGAHLYFTPLVTVGNDDQALYLPEANPLGTLSRSWAYMQSLERHGLIPCFRQLPEQEAQPREGLTAYRAEASLRGETVARIGEIKELPANTNHLYQYDLPRPSLTQSWPLEGLVFSPSLSEYESSKKEKPGKLALEALRAGNDVLLDPPNISAALKTIKKSINAGQLSIEDIDRRVTKLLRLKYQVGLDGVTDTVRYHRAADPRSPLAQQQLYEQAITVAHNEQNLLPIRVLDTLSFAALTITDQPEAAIPFQQSLDHYADFAYYTVPRSEKFDYEQTYAELKQYGHVIVSVQGFKPEDRSPVSKKTLSFLKFLQEEINITVVIFGPPQSLASFDSFNTLVCAYEDDPLAQKVVPQILFGALGATGKLPISVSDALPQGNGENTPALGRLAYTFPEAVGLSEDTLHLIDSLAEWAIREKATPGCQVLVARKGAVVFQKSYGYQTYDKIEPVDDQTIYDIASLTKVAATLQAIMFLQERGVIRLDEKLSTYLPELNATDKKNITVREALLHRTGLRSFIPFWQMTRDQYGLHSELYRFAPEDQFTNQIADGLYGTMSLKDSIWNWTIHSDLLRQRGRRRISWRPLYNYRYSDLGFYMLHRLVEQVTHQPMDEFLEQNFYDPLGLQTLMYNPLRKFPATRIAPTEEDTRFRKTLVRGTVHDEGAALIGGVAGHAGLFSNAHDLAVLMQMNLQDGYYGGTQYLQPGTVERFSTRPFQDSRRALGWDKPEHLHTGGATADEAAYSSYGHLGFTGTSVWVDPKYELVYVFLSNRIYPDAQNTKLLTEGIRTKIQSVVYRAMDDYSGK